jgi:hypothetical protein
MSEWVSEGTQQVIYSLADTKWAAVHWDDDHDHDDDDETEEKEEEEEAEYILWPNTL